MDNPSEKPKDAADTAPRPDYKAREKRPGETGKQDAPNYSDRTDGGTAIKQDDVNSANDE